MWCVVYGRVLECHAVCKHRPKSREPHCISKSSTTRLRSPARQQTTQAGQNFVNLPRRAAKSSVKKLTLGAFPYSKGLLKRILFIESLSMPFKQVKAKGNQQALEYKQIRDPVLKKWRAAEYRGELPSSFPPPVIVLGFPNSGTRLITNVLRSGGVDMGSRTNADKEDAICFAPLFEKYLHEDFAYHRVILRQSGSGIDEQVFARELGAAMCLHFNGKATSHPNYHPPRSLAGDGTPPEASVWGWKNCCRWMWLMPLLDELIPSCTFVHVVRNGLERQVSKGSPDSIHGQYDALKQKVIKEQAIKSTQSDVQATGTVIQALQVDEFQMMRQAKVKCDVDPDRVLLGTEEVPEGMEGVLLWAKMNTLVADYGMHQQSLSA